MGMKTRQTVLSAGDDTGADEGKILPFPPAEPAPPPSLDFSDYAREETPVEKAQELMYEAWQAPRLAAAISIAKSALVVSPDCADAYVLLGNASSNLKDALALYEKGVEAGERALGPDVFRHDVGHFWGLMETRPYMRARAILAQTQRDAGRIDDTIAHYQDLLRLNPRDNQGIRYLLAACLAETHRNRELRALVESYDEDATIFLFLTTLVEFREAGDSPEAQRALVAAEAANPHLVQYLLGDKPMPSERPDYIGFGDETEAVSVAFEISQTWRVTQGALEWLRRSA